MLPHPPKESLAYITPRVPRPSETRTRTTSSYGEGKPKSPPKRSLDGAPWRAEQGCILYSFGASTRILLAVIVKVPEAITFPFRS
jgi:hypothetical protein